MIQQGNNYRFSCIEPVHLNYLENAAEITLRCIGRILIGNPALFPKCYEIDLHPQKD
jgi:hypothetical protein